MAIKFLSSENIAGDIDVTLSKNGITYLAVTNTDTGVSANARVQVVGESSQLDLVATSAGYTGVSGWADSGIISTDSGASGGLKLNSQAGGIQLQSGTTSYVTMSASGTVGIGTTSPTARLDILTNSATGDNNIDRTVRFRADNGEQRFLFNVGRSGNAATLSMYNEAESEKVKISTGSDSYFNGGNVGIGTTSPTSPTSVTTFLAIEGTTAGIVLSDNGNAAYKWDIWNSGGGLFMKYNDTTFGVCQLSNGNVGIGTTSPSNKLDVQITTSNRTTLEPVLSVSASGNGPYTGFGPKISFDSNIYYGAATGNPAGIIETAYIGAVMGTTYATNSDLVFATRDGATSVTEKMRILGNGNVGIGTISATSSSKVTIQAQGADGSDETALVLRNYSAAPYTGYVTQEFEVGTVNMAEISGRRIDINNGEIIFRNKKAGTISASMVIDSSGNVGIATSSIPSDTYTASGGGWKVLQIGQSSQIAAYGTDDEIAICQNTYLNTSGVMQGVVPNVASASMIMVDGKTYFKRATTASNYNQTTSTSMYIDTTGNVGIGDTNPASKLVVAGRVQANSGSEPWAFVSNPTSGNYGGFLIQYNNVTQGACYYNSSSIIIGSEAAIPLRMSAGGQYAMHIDASNRNVHIGSTTDASYKLAVNGTFYAAGNATFAGSIDCDTMLSVSYSDISTGENRGLRIINTSGTDQQWNITAGVTGSENESFCIRDSTANVNALTMAISSGNAVFAGTVETTTLRTDVVNNKANSANIIYRSGTTTIVGGGSSSNKLYVLDNGDVGVNDSTPSYKLDADGTIRATGDVIAYSDRRVKENIKTIDNALNKVLKLRGVSYNRKDIDDKSTKIGVIAQEVLETIPEVVEKDLEDKYSVAYGNMAGLFIEAIKELKAEVEELKKQIKQ